MDSFLPGSGLLRAPTHTDKRAHKTCKAGLRDCPAAPPAGWDPAARTHADRVESTEQGGLGGELCMAESLVCLRVPSSPVSWPCDHRAPSPQPSIPRLGSVEDQPCPGPGLGCTENLYATHRPTGRRASSRCRPLFLDSLPAAVRTLWIPKPAAPPTKEPTCSDPARAPHPSSGPAGRTPVLSSNPPPSAGFPDSADAGASLPGPHGQCQ